MSATEDFHAAYRALLARWPVGVETLDIPTAYGVTRVYACGPVAGSDPPAPTGAPLLQQTPATAAPVPLVLLHGGRTNSAAWFNIVGALAAHRPVLAVDTMGDAGLSANTGAPLRGRDDLMTWLDAVLDAIVGGGRADLCGHSFGGWTALAYSLRCPQRVRRLALLDPTQCFAGFSPACLLHAMPSLLSAASSRRTPEKAARAARAQAKYLAWETAGVEVDEQWLALQELCLIAPTAKVIAGRKPSAAQFEVLEREGIPVLVVLAEHSRVHNLAKVAAGARRVLPGPRSAAPARIETLPGVSHHTAPFGAPARLAELLSAHF